MLEAPMDLKHEVTEKDRLERLNFILKNAKKEPKSGTYPLSQYPFLINGKKFDPVRIKKERLLLERKQSKR